MGDVALPELLDLLSDRYELSIREQAVNSLGYAIRQPTLTNPENVTRAVQALALCLKDDNPRIRMFAASCLAVTGRTALPVLGALREALNDKDDWVRIRAASAVGPLDPTDHRFQTTILDLLNGNESDLRGEALSILSRMGPHGAFAFEAVRGIVADEATDFVLRESAIWTLEEFGPAAKTAIPLLRTLTGHDQARLRVAATKALESLEKQ
jgi:HEAT repeat protein